MLTALSFSMSGEAEVEGSLQSRPDLLEREHLVANGTIIGVENAVPYAH
jgi:hypothetical protein